MNDFFGRLLCNLNMYLEKGKSKFITWNFINQVVAQTFLTNTIAYEVKSANLQPANLEQLNKLPNPHHHARMYRLMKIIKSDGLFYIVNSIPGEGCEISVVLKKPIL